MTLSQVATEVGTSPSHMSMLEQGQAVPSLRLAYRIAKFYGVGVQAIWLGPLPGDRSRP